MTETAGVTFLVKPGIHPSSRKRLERLRNYLKKPFPVDIGVMDFLEGAMDGQNETACQTVGDRLGVSG
ncbi:MAG: hypothetical protein J5J06_13290, partial [Phycisphaerae bacterium]|nr:hypothetical protein [Phycisphaerae bacterium]